VWPAGTPAFFFSIRRSRLSPGWRAVWRTHWLVCAAAFVQTTRVGFWGDEYNLLENNCCNCSDHLLKLLLREKDATGQALPGHYKSLVGGPLRPQPFFSTGISLCNVCSSCHATIEEHNGPGQPYWIFSLAKIGASLDHTAHFVHDTIKGGFHDLVSMAAHLAHGGSGEQAAAGGASRGESFLLVHWVAVPKAMRARRVNRRRQSVGQEWRLLRWAPTRR
jgi:hypothetical protein